MKARKLTARVDVTIYRDRPHRHDARIVELWRELRALVMERARERRSQAQRGRKRPPEVVEAIRAGVTRAWKDPAKRDRILTALKARVYSAEGVEAMTLARRARANRERAAKGDPVATRIFGGAD